MDILSKKENKLIIDCKTEVIEENLDKNFEEEYIMKTVYNVGEHFTIFQGGKRVSFFLYPVGEKSLEEKSFDDYFSNSDDNTNNNFSAIHIEENDKVSVDEVIDILNLKND